jgi:hypothetical protein
MPEGGGSPPAPRRRGRPPGYSRAVEDEICRRLAGGESLEKICQDTRFPAAPTVRGWVQDGRQPFTAEYTRAREIGWQVIAESMLEYGLGNVTGPDGYVDNGEIQRLRLLSENRKWLLSKMLPRQFGDKVTQEIVGDADQPLITRIELVPVDPRPAAKMIDHEPDRDDG